jgi:hypothetical protein
MIKSIEAQRENGINGGVTVQKKNRERLTVYMDAQLYDRFVSEAGAKYRTLSDHMNAIINAHYEAVDAQTAATRKRSGSK